MKATGKRVISYTVGMVLLAVGLALTAQTGLGTSPLTSIAFVLARILDRQFADTTLVMFTVFVLGEMALEKERTARRMVMLLMQIPLSIVFTRVMGLVQSMVDLSACTVAVRLLFLLLAIVLTGVGAALTLRADLIPNPGDGIVKAIATFSGKPLGTVKNVFDIVNVCLAAALSMTVLHVLVGVGIGSVLCMLGVGRVIAAVNRLVR